MESQMLPNQGKRILITLPTGKIISYEIIEKMFFDDKYISIILGKNKSNIKEIEKKTNTLIKLIKNENLVTIGIEVYGNKKTVLEVKNMINLKIKKKINFFLPENKMTIVIGPKLSYLYDLENLSNTKIRLIRNQNKRSIGFYVFCYEKSVKIIVNFLNKKFNQIPNYINDDVIYI